MRIASRTLGLMVAILTLTVGLGVYSAGAKPNCPPGQKISVVSQGNDGGGFTLGGTGEVEYACIVDPTANLDVSWGW